MFRDLGPSMLFNHWFISPSSASSKSLKHNHFHSSLHNNISATIHTTTTTTLFLTAIASFAYAEELKSGDANPDSKTRRRRLRRRADDDDNARRGRRVGRSGRSTVHLRQHELQCRQHRGLVCGLYRAERQDDKR